MKFTSPNTQVAILPWDDNAEYLIEKSRSRATGVLERKSPETDLATSKISAARGIMFGMSLGAVFWLVFFLVWTLSG